MTRTLLFSLTKKDFRVEFIRGTGSGGQKKNKTSSACRITHPESGAVGYAEDSRHQHENKATAFKRMFNTTQFQSWYKIKAGRAALTEDEIAAEVKRQLADKNLLVETWNGERWVRT